MDCIIFASISGYFYLTLSVLFCIESMVSVLVADTHADAFKLGALTAPLGIIYLFAANFKYQSLIDLANVWRYFWLFPCCFFNFMGPYPLNFASYILCVEIFFLPCFILFCDNNVIQIFARLKSHYSASKVLASQTLLTIIGYFGFAFFITLVTYRESNLETFGITIFTGYYLFFDWFAKSGDNNIIRFSILLQILPLLYLLINWISVNFTHDIEIDYMIVYASISTLFYFYTLGWEYFDAMANCGAWAFRCGVINVLVSVIWVMVSPFFDPHPQKIALAQHRFDLMLTLFVVLVVSLMDQIKWRARRSATYITWFLPFQLFWYLNGVKLVIFFNFGSPYHPSWVARGFVTGYYSSNLVTDLTNGFSTVLMTAIATFSATIIVLLNIELKGWNILNANGVLLVTFSALYMMAAVSGFFPKMVASGPWSLFEIRPLIPLPQHHLMDAINTHVRDMILGMMCIMAGLGLNMKANGNLEANNLVIWTVAAITWILFLVPKLFLHLAGYPLI